VTSYGMKQYATEARSSLLLGDRYSGTISDGSSMFAEWTIPVCQNSSYGQNGRMSGWLALSTKHTKETVEGSGAKFSKLL